VQALTFDVLRSLARAEHLRRQLATRAPPPQADALLCVVLALGWREQGMAYTAFTLVNQAVEAAKRRQHGPRPDSSTPACAVSCASATRWWPAPTPTRSPAGTTRAGGSSA
jgi:16S rRNA (cytosine967-C5)-methyltransferase